jgi:23S rRNA (guanosine2251-2'-O)-methyltransferase
MNSLFRKNESPRRRRGVRKSASGLIKESGCNQSNLSFAMKKIFGRKPVLEALKSGAELEAVYIASGQHGEIISSIFAEAKSRGIKFAQLDAPKFKALSENENTQGVIAVGTVQKYYPLDEVIEESKKSAMPLLLLLDSIQDPHNLGAILRTAECAGADGVIITTNNSATVTETVEKISAGAVSHLKISKVNNLVQAIKDLKSEGYWIFGSHLTLDSKEYTKADYKMPLALVLGNEEKGIRKLISENCDFLIKIPMKGKIDSLNVSVAAGIFLFEINRSRNS